MEQVLKRQDVQREHTWDLESIYADNDLWEQDYQKIVDMIPRLASFQGKLGESARALLDALQTRDEAFKLLSQVFVYAYQRKDEDNANSTYVALSDRATSLNARVSAAASYITPEILSIPTEKLDQFWNAESGLSIYRHELSDLLRQKAHVRSAEVEALLAENAEVASAARNVFSMLDNADMKFPKIKDENGNDVDLTKGRYIRFLESPHRAVREGAFKALYSTYAKFRNTTAATYSSSVKKDVFYARARKHASARAAALSASNIPESVYDNLVETVHRNLPSLHRYLQLRKRMLGLNELHLWDLYTPIVPDIDKNIPYEEAVETILKAVAPLGEEYVNVARAGLTTERWVDIFENEGKTSGAYSYGSYTTKPFILMNYTGTLDSMFTLAHELGHSMHAYLSRKHQPYVYGGHTIFVAEVASTFNEALLTEHLLRTTDDKKLRMYVVNHYLEQFRATLYRQTMFAEFEQLTHKRAEENQALTSEWLSKEYYALNQKYLGAEGTVVDQEIELEWSRIPHFYNAFYVYQYATGISAAVALSQKVLREGAPAVEAYLSFLKAGESDYSINLLRGAGVDMASPEPVQKALDVFASLLDEMEDLAK